MVARKIQTEKYIFQGSGAYFSMFCCSVNKYISLVLESLALVNLLSRCMHFRLQNHGNFDSQVHVKTFPSLSCRKKAQKLAKGH